MWSGPVGGNSTLDRRGAVSDRDLEEWEARLVVISVLGAFLWIRSVATFFLLSRDFFHAVSPGGIPKPLLTCNFFGLKPQAL